MSVSLDDIHRLFRVDAQAGRLWWVLPPKNHPRLKGAEAGTPRLGGGNRKKFYWVVKIEGKAWLRAHLIFCAVHGRFAAPCIDHINGNSLDDRIENLREATLTENAWNHKGRSRRIDLPMGVRALNGRFAARIGYHGRQIQIGTFDTADEASCAYRSKRVELYGKFA